MVNALDSQSRGPMFKTTGWAPRSTQPFIFLRLIKLVPGIFENLVVKSKLPPQSGPSLDAVEPLP